MIVIKRNQLLLVGVMSVLAGAPALGASIKNVEACIQSNKRVVIMFTKSSCPYCRYLKPLFNRLQKGITDIVFKIVDVSGNSAFKKKYRFSTVPTIIYFKDGKEVARHGSNNGTMTITRMRTYLNKIK